MAVGDLLSGDTLRAARPKINAINARVIVLEEGGGGGVTAATIGALINSADAKDSPTDSDMLALSDSAASNILKKLTWSYVKSVLKTYFDTVYSPFAVTEVTKASTGPLTAAECSNTTINNYGQGAEMTLTLPPAASGLAFKLIVSTTGNALHIKAGANDKIYLDGTALDDADKVSLATPAIGNSAVFECFKTGESTYDWLCTTIMGAFTDGGA